MVYTANNIISIYLKFHNITHNTSYFESTKGFFFLKSGNKTVWALWGLLLERQLWQFFLKKLGHVSKKFNMAGKIEPKVFLN